MADRKLDASSAVKAARSVGAKLARIRPASMREKSSKLFTSRNSRNELRCATSMRSRWAPFKAVAEASLRASSIGPSISAAPLFLIGLAVCDACADFAGRQFEKAPIRVVKCPKRIETRNEHALACGFTPRRNGNERGLVR